MERDKVLDILKEKGISPTSQRIGMINYLLSEPKHVTAEDVYSAISKLNEKTSMATIYNNLNLFADKGVIKRLIVSSNLTYYDSNTSDHYHMVDTASHQLVDVENKDLKKSDIIRQAEEAILKKTGKSYKINDFQITFTGALA